MFGRALVFVCVHLFLSSSFSLACERALVLPVPDLAYVPGSIVRVEIPEGYSIVVGEDEVRNDEAFCALKVEEIDRPLSDVVDGLVDEWNLLKSGTELVSSSKHRMNAYEGTLVHTRDGEDEPWPFSTWTWAFGDERRCVLVTGEVPQSAPKTTRGILRQFVLSARWDPNGVGEDPAGLPYHLRFAPLGMRVQSCMNGILRLELDETHEGGSKSAASFTCSSVLRGGEADSLKMSALRMKRVRGFDSIKLGDLTVLSIDGLRGYASTSTARDKVSGETVHLYQGMVFEGASYWRFLGVAEEDDRESLMPVYEALTETFTRKRDEVLSKIGRFGVTLSRTWQVHTDEDGLIGASHGVGSCSVKVWRDPLDEFPKAYSLGDCLQETAEGFGAVWDEGVVEELVVSGRGALRYVFLAGGAQIGDVRWVTAVEGDSHVYMVVLSGPICTRASNEGEFSQVLDSLRVDVD